jgi:hypothetical protein
MEQAGCLFDVLVFVLSELTSVRCRAPNSVEVVDLFATRHSISNGATDYLCCSKLISAISAAR